MASINIISESGGQIKKLCKPWIEKQQLTIRENEAQRRVQTAYEYVHLIPIFKQTYNFCLEFNIARNMQGFDFFKTLRIDGVLNFSFFQVTVLRLVLVIPNPLPFIW